MESISYINAPYFAKDRDMHVSESKYEYYEHYSDLIVLEVKTDKETKVLGGTVFNNNEGRVVFIDDFHIDMEPFGTYLYFRNYDNPGVIGKVGTILGNHKINIGGFDLSRQNEGQAMAFVSVDNKISSEVLEEIKQIDGMIEVKVVEI